MSMLLEPYTLRQLTLPNRIAVSPMCQYSSVDGLANGARYQQRQQVRDNEQKDSQQIDRPMPDKKFP